MNFKVTVEDV